MLFKIKKKHFYHHKKIILMSETTADNNNNNNCTEVEPNCSSKTCNVPFYKPEHDHFDHVTWELLGYLAKITYYLVIAFLFLFITVTVFTNMQLTERNMARIETRLDQYKLHPYTPHHDRNDYNYGQRNMDCQTYEDYVSSLYDKIERSAIWKPGHYAPNAIMDNILFIIRRERAKYKDDIICYNWNIVGVKDDKELGKYDTFYDIFAFKSVLSKGFHKYEYTEEILALDDILTLLSNVSNLKHQDMSTLKLFTQYKVYEKTSDHEHIVKPHPFLKKKYDKFNNPVNIMHPNSLNSTKYLKTKKSTVDEHVTTHIDDSHIKEPVVEDDPILSDLFEVDLDDGKDSAEEDYDDDDEEEEIYDDEDEDEDEVVLVYANNSHVEKNDSVKEEDLFMQENYDDEYPVHN